MRVVELVDTGFKIPASNSVPVQVRLRAYIMSVNNIMNNTNTLSIFQITEYVLKEDLLTHYYFFFYQYFINI